MRTKTLGLLVILTLAIAACGGGDGSGVEVGDVEALLQITSEGGFAPVEFALANGPRYTLLGDRRLIFEGFQTMEFPGRLVPPYMVARLDDDQLGAVMAMIDDTGLPEIVDETDDSANDTVADATTEVITYWDAAGSHRLAVYALGIEQHPSDRNAALIELVDTFDRFTANAPGQEYRAEQVKIVSGPATPDPEFDDLRPWPLDDDWAAWQELANGWMCRVLEGAVPEPFRDATQSTTWKIPDVFSYSGPAKLLVRPLLPGETGC